MLQPVQILKWHRYSQRKNRRQCLSLLIEDASTSSLRHIMLIMLSYQCCLIMDFLFSVMIKNVNESLNMERLWKISCEQPLWKYTRSAWCWQHHVTRNRWYPHFYSEKHVQYLGNCTCLPAQFAALRACFGSVSSFTSSQPVSCLVLFTENDSKRNMLSFSTMVWLFPLPGSARALLFSISAVCCGTTVQEM